jgi:hypothetical protein
VKIITLGKCVNTVLIQLWVELNGATIQEFRRRDRLINNQKDCDTYRLKLRGSQRCLRFVRLLSCITIIPTATKIFSPEVEVVPRLSVTIGRQLNQSKRLERDRLGRFTRLSHILPNGSGKVVTK